MKGSPSSPLFRQSKGIDYSESPTPPGRGNVNATNGDAMQNENEMLHNVEEVLGQIRRVEEDLQKLALKIKHHEENMGFLKTQSNILDNSIQDLKGNLQVGAYHPSREAETANENHGSIYSEPIAIGDILKQEKKAASVLCRVKNFETADFPTDIIGIVATLGKAPNDNVSRLLSEYLGLEKMLAIVCKTHEGIKFLEKYATDGKVDLRSGIHGLANSIRRPISGRFFAICLENLRPYNGKYVPKDPHKKLDLLTPILPTGARPPGFLGFAVDMIIVDPMYLSCVTSSGHGLRETLFYSLFSRVQVYNTKDEMEHALPYITDGALSLDGGMIKSCGVFSLGNRQEFELRFPTCLPASAMALGIVESDDRLKLMTWNNETIEEDMKREECALETARSMFNKRKEGFANFIVQSAPLANKVEEAFQTLKVSTGNQTAFVVKGALHGCC